MNLKKQQGVMWYWVLLVIVLIIIAYFLATFFVYRNQGENVSLLDQLGLTKQSVIEVAGFGVAKNWDFEKNSKLTLLTETGEVDKKIAISKSSESIVYTNKDIEIINDQIYYLTKGKNDVLELGIIDQDNSYTGIEVKDKIGASEIVDFKISPDGKQALVVETNIKEINGYKVTKNTAEFYLVGIEKTTSELLKKVIYTKDCRQEESKLEYRDDCMSSGYFAHPYSWSSDGSKIFFTWEIAGKGMDTADYTGELYQLTLGGELKQLLAHYKGYGYSYRFYGLSDSGNLMACLTFKAKDKQRKPWNRTPYLTIKDLDSGKETVFEENKKCPGGYHSVFFAHTGDLLATNCYGNHTAQDEKDDRLGAPKKIAIYNTEGELQKMLSRSDRGDIRALGWLNNNELLVYEVDRKYNNLGLFKIEVDNEYKKTKLSNQYFFGLNYLLTN